MNKIKALIALGLITDLDVHEYIGEQQYQEMLANGEFDNQLTDDDLLSITDIISHESY